MRASTATACAWTSVIPRRTPHAAAVSVPSTTRPRSMRSARKPPALRPQGQAGHLSVHGRRPVASGNVRPQAEAGPSCPGSRCRIFHQRPADPAVAGEHQLIAWAAVDVQEVTARAGRKSELFPHIGSIADDICMIRSMDTEAINHDRPTFMNSGSTICGRPAMGSWLWYGLARCENLPGFVVLTSHRQTRQQQPIASRQWHGGFLPSLSGHPFSPRATRSIH